jgi:hypothetical protein
VKARILDIRGEGNAKCYLCRISLDEYIRGLPQTYQDYEIQREIVTNVYLDHLVETVLDQRHIPAIVLVAELIERSKTKDSSDLTVERFKILDGLQRTFRLKAIYDTMKFCVESLAPDQNYLAWNKYKLSREFSTTLRRLNSNTEVFRCILSARERHGNEGLKSSLVANAQWFEVWAGLSPEEEVRKMLTLNAGHKPVTTRHQLELLFLNLLPLLQLGQGATFKVVREKQVSSSQFSKVRETGTFHFAHIITALLSLLEGAPVVPSTELIQTLQSSERDLVRYEQLTKPAFLREFVAFLVRVDQRLSENYAELGALWFGREVTLAGLFAAIGAFAHDTNISYGQAMQRFTSIVTHQAGVLSLREFEAQRNSVDLSKVNIGNINRNAVYRAIHELLTATSPKKVQWDKHFHVVEG